MAPGADEVLQREGHGAAVHGLDQPPLQLLVVVGSAARWAQAYWPNTQQYHVLLIFQYVCESLEAVAIL